MDPQEIYESHKRLYLKNLWHCARAYNQLGISAPLPSLVRVTLVNTELTLPIRTGEASGRAARVTGGCACALVVNKLVDDFQSRISSGNGVHDAELASISSILLTAPGDYSKWPRPSVVIKFQNVVTLVSGEIEALLTSEGETSLADVLHTVQQTLKIICSDLVQCGVFAVGDLPIKQVPMLRNSCSRIENALGADEFENERVEILGQLQQISKQLPTVKR
jgi:hypothetical protein